MEYREGRKIYFLLVLMVIIIFCGCVFSVIMSDREAPVLNFDKEKMLTEYKDDMQPKELVVGITAYDEQDGDVSDTISVVNITVLSDKETAEVTFAAKDKSNNIVKESIRIKYSGSKSFVDTSVVDKEDMSEQEKDSTQENTTEPSSKEQETTKPVEEETIPKVEDLPEGGSGEPIIIDRAVVDATGIPQIELKYTDYVMHVGAEFSDYIALDWVNATYDNGDNPVANRIQIDGRGDVDTSVIGDYVLTYRVTDHDGNVSENRYLTIHVIE